MSARRIIPALLLCLSGMAGFAAPVPREAVPLRDAFEKALSGREEQGAGSYGSLGMEYLEALRALKLDMQAQGRVRAMVVILDEILRFSKTRTAPPAPAVDPPELQSLQQDYLGRLARRRYSNEVDIIILAAGYLQKIGEVRAKTAQQGDLAALKLLDDERDRVLLLPRIRSALEATREKPPAASARDAELAAAAAGVKTNSALKNRRELRIYRLSDEDVRTVMGYTVTAELAEDESKVRTKTSEYTGGKTTVREGLITYVPRITINCRNLELPADCRVVIEYYGQSVTDHEKRREGAETIPLPALARGVSHTFEAKGVALHQFEQVTVNSRGNMTKSRQGSEFFGIIVNIFDADNQPLLQRFTPQSLAKDVLPAAPRGPPDAP